MSDSATPSNLGPGGTQVPPKPKPYYPDTPWWASLIAVFATAIVSILGTAYVLGVRPTGTASMPAGASLIVDTLTYFPHILLLFGILADMFTYDGVWSIPSLVGLISIVLNYPMKFFWLGIENFIGTAKDVAARGTTTTAVGGADVGSFFRNYDGCSVQGFESLATDFAPQTLVVTATVFCYYIFDLVRNRGWINSVAAILIFGLVYVGQVIILGTCGSGAYSGNLKALMALFEGIVFGGSAYGIVQTYAPTRLPSATISPFQRRDKSELTMGPDGKMYDADGYPYIVLPNGQTVPDVSSQQAKMAFASMVGQNLGTGRPATASTCNA